MRDVRGINMPLEARELNSIEELEAMEPEWRALWELDSCATPFQSPDWLTPWTRRMWGGGKLAVLTAREGGELAGVAPFFLWGFGGHPEVIRLSFLGAGISDYLGTIAAPGFAAEFAELVMEWLARSQSRWQVCDLQELRPCSPLLRADVPASLTGRTSPLSVCPVVSLPRTMEELHGNLPARFRDNLRRAGVTLRRTGAVEFSRATGAEVPDLMQTLFRLHEARWSAKYGHGMFHTERVRGFHLEAADRLDRAGVLRLYALRVNGSVVGVQYNLAAKGRSYVYLSGFDPAWSRYSPGGLLLEHAIAEAIAEGAGELDFLRNGEAYKYQWGARDRTNRKLLIWPSAFAERVA